MKKNPGFTVALRGPRISCDFCRQAFDQLNSIPGHWSPECYIRLKKTDFEIFACLNLSMDVVLDQLNKLLLGSYGQKKFGHKSVIFCSREIF